MSEFNPVSTRADLEQLDDAEMVAGYRAGLTGDPPPGSDKSRSYWHGWRNGMTDTRRAPLDDHQQALAFELYGRNRLN